MGQVIHLITTLFPGCCSPRMVVMILCRWVLATAILIFAWYLHEMFYLGAVLCLPPQTAHASQDLIMPLCPSHLYCARSGDRDDIPSLSFSGTSFFFSFSSIFFLRFLCCSNQLFTFKGCQTHLSYQELSPLWAGWKRAMIPLIFIVMLFNCPQLKNAAKKDEENKQTNKQKCRHFSK